MKTVIFHVIYINKRMSTNTVCFVLFTPLMYFFCNIYAKYFIYVSILWLDPPYLPVM